jgi:hypothetical protein
VRTRFTAEFIDVGVKRMEKNEAPVELGPLASSYSSSGIWIGPASEESAAVGMVADASAAVALKNRFGGSASAVYYPHPLPFAEHPQQPTNRNCL